MKTYNRARFSYYFIKPFRLIIDLFTPDYPSPRKVRREAIGELEEDIKHLDYLLDKAKEVLEYRRFKISALEGYKDSAYEENSLLNTSNLKQKISELEGRHFQVQSTLNRYTRQGVVDTLDRYHEKHIAFVSLIGELREAGILDSNRKV